MGLRDELQQSVAGGKCGIRILLDSLPDDVAAELQELLTDSSVQSTALARLARAKGWKVNEGSFARHRRGACKCL